MEKTYLSLLFFLFPVSIVINAYAQTSVDVFVNNRGGNAIQLYDENGNYLGDFVSANSGGLSGPEDVLFLPDGRMLVTGFQNTAIKQYNGQNGEYLGNFSSGYALQGPSKMSIGWDSLIYVTQWNDPQNKIVRFDLNGHFVDTFNDVPAPNGLGHTWDAHHNFYISLFGDGGNGTIHRFDSLGNSMGTFINSAVLQGPTDIWFDENGDMLVQDWSVGRILKYDSDGQFINVFATGLTNPEGVGFLLNGNIIMGDWGVDAVRMISSTGENLGFFASGNGLSDPNNVAIRKKTTSSVEDASANKLQLKVYPNPVKEVLNFELTEQIPVTTDYLAQVLSLEGKLLMEHRISRNENHGINVEELEAGNYLLKVKMRAEVFIKQFVILY